MGGTYSSRKGKAFEYWLARKLGLKRNPLSGANNTGDDGAPRSGDLIHPTIEIEAKHRRQIGIFQWWFKLKEDQKKSGKPYCVLFIRQDGTPGKPVEALAVISVDEYLRLKQKAGEW